jgi:hypothetical protein
MWHPEALDTLDTHFGPSSQFTENKGSTWITSISLAHWEVEDVNLNPRFHDDRENPLLISIGAKAYLGEKTGIIKSSAGRIKFEESSSSLAITGDQQGLFWNCLIISPNMNEELVKDHVDGIATLLSSFLHQRATGRCLSFLTLLGHVCVHLAREYDKAIEVLMDKLSLGVSLNYNHGDPGP